MGRYNLGPNGGILTSLNLFTTKFDQVLTLVEKRSSEVEWVPLIIVVFFGSILRSYIILDTPGQIEIFTWSASGAILTDALAAAGPACLAYIIDTPRCSAPATFMSNMLYACRQVFDLRPFAFAPLIDIYSVFYTKLDSRLSSYSTRRTSRRTNLR